MFPQLLAELFPGLGAKSEGPSAMFDRRLVAGLKLCHQNEHRFAVVST